MGSALRKLTVASSPHQPVVSLDSSTGTSQLNPALPSTYNSFKCNGVEDRTRLTPRSREKQPALPGTGCYLGPCLA